MITSRKIKSIAAAGVLVVSTFLFLLNFSARASAEVAKCFIYPTGNEVSCDGVSGLGSGCYLIEYSQVGIHNLGKTICSDPMSLINDPPKCFLYGSGARTTCPNAESLKSGFCYLIDYNEVGTTNLGVTVCTDPLSLINDPPKCFVFGSGAETTCPDSGSLYRGFCYLIDYNEAGTTNLGVTSCEKPNSLVYGASSGSSTSAGGVDEPKFVKNDCNDTVITESNCGILRYLILFINVLSGLVGIVVVGSIIYGGVQYSMAGSDPQKVSSAKNRIRNALIALFFFLFMYSFLNYLIPGGVL